MGRTHYRAGDWDAWCEECGFKYKASKLRKRYDGYHVCHKCWEPRHPQELYRYRNHERPVPWTTVGPESGITPVGPVGRVSVNTLGSFWFCRVNMAWDVAPTYIPVSPTAGHVIGGFAMATVDMG